MNLDSRHQQIVEDCPPAALAPDRHSLTLVQEVETAQRHSQTPIQGNPIQGAAAQSHARLEMPGGVFARQLSVHVLKPEENRFAIVTITVSRLSLNEYQPLG